VLDVSVAMAWCFEDEADKYADSILDLLVESEVLVPTIWPFEVANVLLAAERRKRLTEADSLRFVELLRDLPITVDDGTSEHALSEILFLGRQQGLSSYDAAYLELAMREGVALATRDLRLREASERCGVKFVSV
jgi:predicted nucleic acid-binding protein